MAENPSHQTGNDCFKGFGFLVTFCRDFWQKKNFDWETFMRGLLTAMKEENSFVQCLECLEWTDFGSLHVDSEQRSILWFSFATSAESQFLIKHHQFGSADMCVFIPVDMNLLPKQTRLWDWSLCALCRLNPLGLCLPLPV